MSFAIMRMQKLKGSGKDLKGISIHIDRANNGESVSPSNSSGEVDSNIHWDENGEMFTQGEWNKKTPLYERIEQGIAKRYTSKRKIRANSVKAIEYILTSDSVTMERIFREEKAEEWVKANKEFLSEVYGSDNVLSFHLHLDEKTPHLHAVILPITEDGRLCAKDFINGRQSLIKQQDLYAEKMEKFGMQRGEKGSKTQHRKPNTYTTENRERNH